MTEANYLRIARQHLGEFNKVVYLPYRAHTRSVRCKDKSHPNQKTIVLIWHIYEGLVRLEQKAGLCTVCRKLYVVVGKDDMEDE